LLIHEYTHPVAVRGRSFRARVFASARSDGTWTAWLEFEPDDSPGRCYSTGEETSQPNLAAIEYWAGGLEPVYLEGALGRALDREMVVAS
jgi:hypothetical protein